MLARLYLDQRPHLRDWVQRHHDEYGLFMRFVRICSQASASIQAPNASQIPPEVMTVMAVARFQGIALIPEQILTAQQDASIQYLTRQLIVYLQMRANLPRDILNQAVGVETLYLCEHRGFPFTLPHHLLQTQLPSQPQQDGLQQCSNNSRNDATVNQPYSNTTPVPQQASPCPSQPSGRLEQVQNFRSRASDPSYTHPRSRKTRDKSARSQEQLPIAAPPTNDTISNAPQAQLEQPNAPSPTGVFMGSSRRKSCGGNIHELARSRDEHPRVEYRQPFTGRSSANAEPARSVIDPCTYSRKHGNPPRVSNLNTDLPNTESDLQNVPLGYSHATNTRSTKRRRLVAPLANLSIIQHHPRIHRAGFSDQGARPRRRKRRCCKRGDGYDRSGSRRAMDSNRIPHPCLRFFDIETARARSAGQFHTGGGV